MLQGRAKKGDVLAEATLTHSKSTAGAHVFANQDAGFQSIYIPRVLFNGNPPDKIKLRMTLTLEDV